MIIPKCIYVVGGPDVDTTEAESQSLCCCFFRHAVRLQCHHQWRPLFIAKQPAPLRGRCPGDQLFAAPPRSSTLAPYSLAGRLVGIRSLGLCLLSSRARRNRTIKVVTLCVWFFFLSYNKSLPTRYPSPRQSPPPSPYPNARSGCRGEVASPSYRPPRFRAGNSSHTRATTGDAAECT